jgi:hypothetical protein
MRGRNSKAQPRLLLLPLFGAVAAYSFAVERNVSVVSHADQNQFVTQPERGRFCVALDIGHLPTAGGAMAAYGKMEY